ncbi:hypothetical protein LPJ62_001415 [Coemansia sp. RSA 2167]|nr:hypothetical protein LPJ62_001415 [Coemansia sp. RSA 2167]
MMPTNRFVGPYHRPFPMPPSELESLDEGHERVHTTSDKLMPRSTQFKVAPINTLPRMKAPPSYPTQVMHYSPYTVAPRQYRYNGAPAPFSSSSSSSSPPVAFEKPNQNALITQQPTPPRKRSRNAWPADMTRQMINVLLNEFLDSATFQTTIYRSREERDHRFIPSGRSILEEYNKIQNVRRRYFIPLSYLLQWDQLRSSTNHLRTRQRANIEKKLAKQLERNRLELIFNAAMKKPLSDDSAEMSDHESEQDNNGKPVFELDIFVSELKRRDMRLWNRGVAAFQAWVSRKCSVDFLLNHA